MGLSESWEQILTTALLGTGRAGSGVRLDPPLGEFARGTGAAVEFALLAAAGSVDVYQRAGVRSEAYGGEIEEAPGEGLGAISAMSALQLGRMLGDEFREVLPEFLGACAAAKKRVAEGVLPKLLSFASQASSEEMLPLIEPVLGARGRWLMEQNAAWRKIFAKPTAGDFETGSRQVRYRYVKELRRTDAAAARALLEKTWRQEAPEERVNFIDVFEVGLTAADEPFLEAALDDKRKEVRETAAGLLARLVDSPLAQRMLARVSPMVVFKKKLLRGVSLEVTLRDDITEDMARDGIGSKSPSKAIGEKAWILTQIIGGTPLSHWTLPPDEILGLAGKHDFEAALIAGFIRAAARQKSVPWAMAILSRFAACANKEVEPYAEAVSSELRALYRVLPMEQREAVASYALSARAAEEDHDLRQNFIRPLDHAWSLDFSRTFVASLAAYLGSLGKRQVYGDYVVNGMLAEQVPLRIHPDTYAEIGPFIPADVPPPLARALEALITTVTFRHHMLKELRT